MIDEPILEFTIHVPCYCDCGCKESTAMGVQPCMKCQQGFHEERERAPYD